MKAAKLIGVITAIAFTMLVCPQAARGESAALDPVRLQLSNDLAAITATNDGSKATLKTFRVLSNALIIAWSTNSGEFILSRLARALPARRYPQYDPVLLQAGSVLRAQLLADFGELGLSVVNLPPPLAAGPVAGHFVTAARSQQSRIYGPVGQRLRAATNTLQFSNALLPARRFFSSAQISLEHFFAEIAKGSDGAFAADFQIPKFKFRARGSASASVNGTNIIVTLEGNSGSLPDDAQYDFDLSLSAPLVPQPGFAPGAFVDNIPRDARADLGFISDGGTFGGSSAFSGGVWTFIRGTNIVGVFECDGDKWKITHGHFVVPLLL